MKMETRISALESEHKPHKICVYFPQRELPPIDIDSYSNVMKVRFYGPNLEDTEPDISEAD